AVGERDQHHAGLHRHQHVSQAVGGLGLGVSQVDRPAHRPRPGALRGKEAKPLQPLNGTFRCDASYLAFKKECAMRNLRLLSLLILAFAAPAFADEWTKQYAVGTRPELHVNADDAHL